MRHVHDSDTVSTAEELKGFADAIAPGRLLRKSNRHRHPILGDELNFSDRVSWRAQGIIRRWTFIVTVTLVSVFWWLQPGLFHDPNLTKWNAGASLMALIIESVVGIGMFNQTTRDALILRRLDKVLSEVETITRQDSADLDELEQLDRASFRAVIERLDAIEGRQYRLLGCERPSAAPVEHPGAAAGQNEAPAP